jgi:hypothetical protein
MNPSETKTKLMEDQIERTLGASIREASVSKLVAMYAMAQKLGRKIETLQDWDIVEHEMLHRVFEIMRERRIQDHE